MMCPDSAPEERRRGQREAGQACPFTASSGRLHAVSAGTGGISVAPSRRAPGRRRDAVSVNTTHSGSASRTGSATMAAAAGGTVVPGLLAISVSHMLNDLIQSLIPAIYPILKQSYGLDFG